MRIALFTDTYFPRVNGVGVSVKCFGEALAKAGHEVCVVCPAYKADTDVYTETTDIKGFSLLRIPSVAIVFSKEDHYVKLSKWKRITAEVDKFKPDVVHINTEFSLGIFGMKYATRNNLALVYTSHTMWESYVENYIRFLPSEWARKFGRKIVCFFAKRAQVVITPTKRMCDLVSSYGINRPIEVLPTGIEESVSKIDEGKLPAFTEDIYREFPALKNKKILLYVGRVVKEKNLYMLFDVFAKVREKIPGTALFFVGGGPELEPLQQKAATLAAANDICFAGYRDRNMLSYFYHLADVFVFPSRTETQGLVTLEAMRASRPVVAIGEMGTLDVMQGDNGGFMVPNDVDAFADKVIALLSDQALHAQKSKEAREWSAKWSMDYLTPKVEGIYQKAIETVKSSAQ